MAVWPFCRPWPRTSVTVMPGVLSFSSASRTSSTLFGRTMLLMSFIGVLQSAFQLLPQFPLVVFIERAALPRHVEHVDGLASLGRNQREIDVAPPVGDGAADPIEQARCVGRDDLDGRVPLRVAAVEADACLDVLAAAMHQAAFPSAQQRAHVDG